MSMSPRVLQFAVEDLLPGDAVDLEIGPCIPADENLAVKYEYGIVECVEQETPECVVVHFQNGFPSYAYPTGTVLTVVEN